MRIRLLALLLFFFLHPSPFTLLRAQYVPTKENLERRKEFEDMRFGIFLHWGIYSTFAQGEWYLNNNLKQEEYAKSADAFYPHRFNAREWVKAIKDSGAKYITFTTRHHDGFSMWDTRMSDYNIVRATPFGRDVLRELANACHSEGVRLHLYYSILDWMRPDYPVGRTGLKTGRELHPNYDEYLRFMKLQCSELLMQYGDIGALWLDGYWDHDSDTIPFDWRMPEFYASCHSLRPDLLIGNNHHLTPLEGEDFQMFERDLPGENKSGLSGQDISQLPLEMCQTMNGMWGYKVSDTNYKSTDELITLLVRAAGKGSNLLLNIGPQPNGELPAVALARLKEIGQWMRAYGNSIYATRRTALGEQSWGTTTERKDTLFLHILDREAKSVEIPMERRPLSVESMYLSTAEYRAGEQQASKNRQGTIVWRYDKKAKLLTIELPAHTEAVDYIVEVIRASNAK